MIEEGPKINGIVPFNPDLGKKAEEKADPQKKYSSIVKEITQQKESQLRIEEYYLCEQDGDTWATHNDFLERTTRIGKMREELQNQIRSEVISKVIFDANNSTPKETAA